MIINQCFHFHYTRLGPLSVTSFIASVLDIKISQVLLLVVLVVPKKAITKLGSLVYIIASSDKLSPVCFQRSILLTSTWFVKGTYTFVKIVKRALQAKWQCLRKLFHTMKCWCKRCNNSQFHKEKKTRFIWRALLKDIYNLMSFLDASRFLKVFVKDKESIILPWQ